MENKNQQESSYGWETSESVILCSYKFTNLQDMFEAADQATNS